ncbi:hypothetical protein H4217_007689 [Coemansia sp. RSA 1939]|nr:hypothetical protein H4217_007689 [Coemansia sp. RSA 1939]
MKLIIGRLPASLAVAVALLAAAAGVSARKQQPLAAHDEYKLNDEIQIECIQTNDAGGRASTEKSAKYLTPTCMETRKPLHVVYGYDGPIQCSVSNDDPFHRTMQHSIAFDTPMQCRIARNKMASPKHLLLPVRVEGNARRVAGSFNAVLHAQNGNLIAAAVYPVADHALPQAVAGVSTIQIWQKWYDGAGLSTLMATRRHEDEFIIQPIVALMFCVLTACVVYVAGRVYVESSVIPRAVQRHLAENDAVSESKKSQ